MSSCAAMMLATKGLDSTEANLLAWGDESIRITNDPPLYLIAASYTFDEGSIDLSALESIKPKSAEKLHWRDMGNGQRMRSINAIGTLNLSHTVIVGCNVVHNKQERARRKCLERLIVELEQIGVSELILESRGPYRDKADIAFLLTCKQKGIAKRMDFSHRSGSIEKPLWIPDQVLGAYGDISCGSASEELLFSWNELEPSVRILKLDL